jgi:predicted Zn-dependent protease
MVQIYSWWVGELRWARNRVTITSDRRQTQLYVLRSIRNSIGKAWTNLLDDDSLRSAVRAAERVSALFPGTEVKDLRLPPPELPIPSPVIWSDATFNATAEMRGDIGSFLSQHAATSSMLSAGFLRMNGGVIARRWFGVDDSTNGTDDQVASAGNDREFPGAGSNALEYEPYTMSECSMTVRDADGLGSGWAGLSGYDWSAIDGKTLAERALEKCLKSLNPVAIEPGRYTVVLEPAAAYPMVGMLMSQTSRAAAESGRGPFVLERDNALGLFRTKLGLKIVDPRVTISHDPDDPELGEPARPGTVAVAWIEKGILKTMANDRETHALPKLNDHLGSLGRRSFRMQGGSTSIEEMISSTRRGLLVTRFVNLILLDSTSVLCTGLTRDGLWLIEQGKITKAVKNMRFTESPLFMLNNLEQLGVAVPVFTSFRNQPAPVIVPALKINDFSFTSMVDSI